MTRDWTPGELTALWRALRRLPPAHIEENEDLRGISRGAPPAGHADPGGLAARGRYQAEDGLVILYDAAFLALSEWPLEEVVAQLVGQSLFRRLGPTAGAAGGGDAAGFGARYARFHLLPERLKAEDPAAFAALQQVFFPQPAALPDAEMLRSVQAWSRQRGLSAGGALSFQLGPAPLDDPALTGPLRFLQAVLPETAGGPAPLWCCVAFDSQERRVRYREPEAFPAFLKAVDYPRRGHLPAEAVLLAWYVLARGTLPRLAQGPSGGGDPALRGLVAAPATHTEADGARTTVGWSCDSQGWRWTRHEIRVRPDGEVAIRSQSGEDVLAERAR